jgi:hypothetical protein
MENWMGLLGALVALLAVFMLYVGGVSVVLRLLERLLPAKTARERDHNAPPSMP